MLKEDYEKRPYREGIEPYPDPEIIEPIYWRKCWGIRNKMIQLLHMDTEECEKEIDPEDIPAIIRVLKPFLSRDYWDENADSIWEYDEFFDTLYKQLVFLEWFKTYYAEHPELEVYFYDSY